MPAGTIEMTVTDTGGTALENVAITLKNEAEHFNYLLHTNARGFAGMQQAPVTHFDVTLELAGYQTQNTAINVLPVVVQRFEYSLQPE